MNSTKQFSQITLPGINLPAVDTNDTGIDTNSAYLEELKALVAEEVKNNPSKYDIDKHAYIRYQYCLKAKQILGKTDAPTPEELDHCFPDYDHSEWIKKCKESEKRRKTEQLKAGQPKSRIAEVPTRQQAKQRLNNSPQAKDSEYELTADDWKWIEKGNHELGGRLDYGAGFTPEMLELDIKLNLSNHRTRLYVYASLHCAKATGISSRFTIEFLAEKLQCSRRDIREGMKDLRKMGLALPNPYPKHYTKDFTFILPYVKGLAEVSKEVGRIESLTGMDKRELWERREEFGYVVKSGGETEGEAEGEGESPPSSPF